MGDFRVLPLDSTATTESKVMASYEVVLAPKNYDFELEEDVIDLPLNEVDEDNVRNFLKSIILSNEKKHRSSEKKHRPDDNYHDSKRQVITRNATHSEENSAQSAPCATGSQTGGVGSGVMEAGAVGDMPAGAVEAGVAGVASITGTAASEAHATAKDATTTVGSAVGSQAVLNEQTQRFALLLKRNFFTSHGYYEIETKEILYISLVQAWPVAVIYLVFSRMVDENIAVQIWHMLLSNGSVGFNLMALSFLVLLVSYVFDIHKNCAKILHKIGILENELMVWKDVDVDTDRLVKVVSDDMSGNPGGLSGYPMKINGVAPADTEPAAPIARSTQMIPRAHLGSQIGSSNTMGDKNMNQSGSSGAAAANNSTSSNGGIRSSSQKIEPDQGTAKVESKPPTGGKIVDSREYAETRVILWNLRKAFLKNVLPFVIGILLGLVGLIFSAKKYPEAPLLIAFMSMVGGITLIRYTVSAWTHDRHFYKAISQSGVCIGLVFLLWWIVFISKDNGRNFFTEAYKGDLAAVKFKKIYDVFDVVYERDCNQTIIKKMEADLEGRFDKILGSCKSANLIIWITWIGPLLVSLEVFLISYFALVRLWTVKSYRDKVKQFEALLKLFVMWTLFLFVLVWVATEVGSTSMEQSTSIVRFVFIGMFFLLLWAYLTFDFHNIEVLKRVSPFVRVTANVFESSWSRALLFLVLALPSPLFLMIDYLNQKVRRWRWSRAKGILLRTAKDLGEDLEAPPAIAPSSPDANSKDKDGQKDPDGTNGKKEKTLQERLAEAKEKPTGTGPRVSLTGIVSLPSGKRMTVSHTGLEFRNQSSPSKDNDQDITGSSGRDQSISNAERQAQALVAPEFRPIIVNRQYRQLKDAEMSRPYTKSMVALQRRVLNSNLYSVVICCAWWVYLYAVLFVLVQRAAYVFLSWLNQELYKMDIEAVLLFYYIVGLTMFLLPPVPGLPVYITGGILLGSRMSKRCAENVKADATTGTSAVLLRALTESIIPDVDVSLSSASSSIAASDSSSISMSISSPISMIPSLMGSYSHGGSSSAPFAGSTSSTGYVSTAHVSPGVHIIPGTFRSTGYQDLITQGSHASRYLQSNSKNKSVTCSELTSTSGPFDESGADGKLGFWWGVAIASVMGSVLKFTAVFMQQKLIGENLGKSLWVQSFVGIDQPFIRAIEMILNESPGKLTKAKVAVLVGGPDWPTSVITGILKLPVLQMLIGTTPVILLIIPSVLVGGFLLKQTLNPTWSAAAKVVTIVTMIVQGSTMLYAFLMIQDRMVKHRDALSRSRPEHAAVEKNSLIDRLRQKIIEKKTYWYPTGSYATETAGLTSPVPGGEDTDEGYYPGMESSLKFNMLGTVFVGSLYCYLTPFWGKCFRDFELISEIDAPYSRKGLQGDPLSIILPMGWVSMAILGLVMIFHYVLIKRVENFISPKTMDLIHEEVAEHLESVHGNRSSNHKHHVQID